MKDLIFPTPYYYYTSNRFKRPIRADEECLKVNKHRRQVFGPELQWLHKHSSEPSKILAGGETMDPLPVIWHPWQRVLHSWGHKGSSGQGGQEATGLWDRDDDETAELKYRLENHLYIV
jgi:hypothetical protein